MIAAALTDALQKRVSTCRARAALVGATLIVFEDDFGKTALTLTRWCLTRTFSLAEIDELEDLLARMGAPG